MKNLIIFLLFLFSIGYSQQINYKFQIPKNSIFLDSIYIDTLLFENYLKEFGIYDDFRNNKIKNIEKFNICLQKSKVYPTIREEKNKVKSRKISTKIGDDIKNVIKLSKTKQIPIPEPIIREPASEIIFEEPTGKLTYVIGDTMELNKPHIIDLTLSKNMSEKQIIRLIDGFKNKELIDTLITITSIMRAQLIDPTGKNFVITPITNEIQTTDNLDFIRWQWQIVPLTEGVNYLSINVDNYINDNPQSVNIYNGQTYVFTVHTIWGDIWNWISTYWTYITYVLGAIGAVFAFIYKEKLFGLFKKKS